MEKNLTDIAVNSVGAVMVTILFLWYLDRQEQRQKDLIENHLGNIQKGQNKMGVIIQKLTNALNGLKGALNGKKKE